MPLSQSLSKQQEASGLPCLPGGLYSKEVHFSLKSALNWLSDSMRMETESHLETNYRLYHLLLIHCKKNVKYEVIRDAIAMLTEWAANADPLAG